MSTPHPPKADPQTTIPEDPSIPNTNNLTRYFLSPPQRAASINALVLLIGYIGWFLSRSHIQTAASVMITQGVVRASTYGMYVLTDR